MKKDLTSRIVMGYHSIGEICKIWIGQLDDFYEYYEYFVSILDLEEYEKHEKITNKNGKKNYAIRKGLLRVILTDFFELENLSFHFCYNEYRKPYILKNGKVLNYNISHSKELFIIGMHRHKEIGVDIEKIDTPRKYLNNLLPQFSVEEINFINSYHDIWKSRITYIGWVQKEAIAKAIGKGLAMDFQQIPVSLDTLNHMIEYDVNVENSYIHIRVQYDERKNHCYAIAIKSE